MPNTRITKQKWKDHFSYSKRVYIFGTLLCIAVVSLLFSVTRYTPPDERSVSIELVDSYTMTDNLEDVETLLLEKGVEYDETLEQVQFLSIAYSGTSDDYYGAQVYTVQLYAGENDIYIEDETLLQQLIGEGYCARLEEYEGFDEFVQKHPEVTVYWAEEPTESDEDEDEPKPEVPKHAYALSADTLTGFAERGAFANSGKYVLLAVTSKNADTSFKVLTYMYDVLGASEEDGEEGSEKIVDEAIKESSNDDSAEAGDYAEINEDK